MSEVAWLGSACVLGGVRANSAGLTVAPAALNVEDAVLRVSAFPLWLLVAAVLAMP